MSELNNTCLMCARINDFTENKNHPFLIHEFEHSLFVVGEHQFYEGYSQLLYKKHARETHELEPSIQAAIFAEMMIAVRAVAETFKPWKMNYSCYGNVVPHIHWHLFPRYADDVDRQQVPWFHAADFDKYLTDNQTSSRIAAQIRANLHL